MTIINYNTDDRFITYDTHFGRITLYKNDLIRGQFDNNSYWEINEFISLLPYINRDKNILEIGGHCGKSSILYAQFLNDNSKVYVYEPQLNMFNLLLHNITNNNLDHKIIPYNNAVFCDNISMQMNNIEVGMGTTVNSSYSDTNSPCNFGGLCLGTSGESIDAITIDSMKLQNIGFIHCDAQGSENFIFSNALETITHDKPVIFYENNEKYDKILYKTVCTSYPQYLTHSQFSIESYCIHKLKYSAVKYSFPDNSYNDLLIP